MTGTSPSSLDAHELEVFCALEQAAEQVVAAGFAHIEVQAVSGARPTLISLIPKRQGAARVVVQVDDERQLTLYPGSSGMLYEVWSEQRDELLREVRESALAVIDGGYFERVRLTSDARLGKGKGTIRHSGGKPTQVRYSSAETLGERGPWKRCDYLPYSHA